MSVSADTRWNDLLEAFVEGLENSIEKVKEKDVENIPGAKEALLERLETMKIHFPRNEGEIFIRTIDDKIQNAFFPKTTDFANIYHTIR